MRVLRKSRQSWAKGLRVSKRASTLWSKLSSGLRGGTRRLPSLSRHCTRWIRR